MLAETSVSVIKAFTVVAERQIDTDAVTGAFVTFTVVDLWTNQRIFTVAVKRGLADLTFSLQWSPSEFQLRYHA